MFDLATTRWTCIFFLPQAAFDGLKVKNILHQICYIVFNIFLIFQFPLVDCKR